jgi:hypothetical protein
MAHRDNNYTDVATRQIKINEYAYQNKMETLFFLQIMLVSILIIGIFAFGASLGFFSPVLIWYIAIILFVMDVLILAGRAAYTMNLRDRTLWNRRFFTYEDAVPAAPYTSSFKFSFPSLASFGFPSNFDMSGVDVAAFCKASNVVT